MISAFAILSGRIVAAGAPPQEASTAADIAPEAAAPSVRPFFIREYRVRGVKILTPVEVEEAVTPFLGPQRTVDDVEQARAALEKIYHDKGYQTVSIQVPQQQGRGGVV